MAQKKTSLSEPTTTKMAAAATIEPRTSALFTTSTGVTLKVTQPKTRIIYNLYAQNPAPKPPKIVIEEGGKKREEENVNDPDYVEAEATYRTRIYESYIKIIILTSTEIVSLPQGMLSFDEDKDWQDELEAMGLDVGHSANRKERYLEWFFYRVAPTHEDVFGIQNLSESLSETTAGETEAAEETFQDKR